MYMQNSIKMYSTSFSAVYTAESAGANYGLVPVLWYRALNWVEEKLLGVAVKSNYARQGYGSIPILW
jgi:hypothetical protein